MWREGMSPLILTSPLQALDTPADLPLTGTQGQKGLARIVWWREKETAPPRHWTVISPTSSKPIHLPTEPVRKGMFPVPSHSYYYWRPPISVDTGCPDLLRKENAGGAWSHSEFHAALFLGIGGVHTPPRHKTMLWHQYLLKSTRSGRPIWPPHYAFLYVVCLKRCTI